MLTLGAAAAVLAVGTGAIGSDVAAARPVSITLHYTCNFPMIGGQPVTVQVNADVPSSDTVGVPTRPFPIDVVATVGDLFTSGLNFLGVHSVEGTAEGNVNVAAPQGAFRVGIPFTIPSTTVPASGSFRVPVTGSAPSLRFTRPGTGGRLTAGDINLHLAARDAKGNPTLGKLDLPCTLDNGQNDVIGSFDVKPRLAATPTVTTSSRVTSPATPGRTTSGDGRDGAKASPAATSASGPAASGKAGTSIGDGSTTAGTSGSTVTPPTGSALETTAKPTKTPTADGAFLNPTGAGTSNGRAPILLTVGGCVAAVGALGYGRVLWNRSHASSEGFLTCSQPEEVPEQEHRL
ncbi:DUF6801 domain-containing protein [Streptomyces sp. NPDC059278]|uniref:DUF6801 domain-containing protein n=1 Tax=Streptomyces sp. NPDC059278 TaxID=3346801 RepID=UPI00367B9556